MLNGFLIQLSAISIRFAKSAETEANFPRNERKVRIMGAGAWAGGCVNCISACNHCLQYWILNKQMHLTGSGRHAISASDTSWKCGGRRFKQCDSFAVLYFINISDLSEIYFSF